MANRPAFQARQGDVLVQAVDRPAPRAAPVQAEDGRVVLARGELTGHHHSLDARSGVLLFRPDDMPASGGLLLVPDGGAALEHQEHAAIPLPAGPFRVVRQVEWSDQREPRRVED